MCLFTPSINVADSCLATGGQRCPHFVHQRLFGRSRIPPPLLDYEYSHLSFDARRRFERVKVHRTGRKNFMRTFCELPVEPAKVSVSQEISMLLLSETGRQGKQVHLRSNICSAGLRLTKAAGSSEAIPHCKGLRARTHAGQEGGIWLVTSYGLSINRRFTDIFVQGSLAVCFRLLSAAGTAACKLALERRVVFHH